MRTNIQVSIAAKKYKTIVSEMVQHLELSLPGYTIGQPALAGAIFLRNSGGKWAGATVRSLT